MLNLKVPLALIFSQKALNVFLKNIKPILTQKVVLSRFRPNFLNKDSKILLMLTFMTKGTLKVTREKSIVFFRFKKNDCLK